MESDINKNSLHEGYRLHWYEIKNVIGSGGFGITYLAHDNNLDRFVAIKEFMPEEFATRESDSTVHPKTSDKEKLYDWGLEHFIKEAQTLAKFNHPNIVRVLSVFEKNNTAYMIMEYVQGEDLSTIYKNSPTFSEEQFLDTFIPIMDGLALVHNAGFIHRDIKPANIYICENDSPLLLDFGSARQPIDGKTKALTSLVTYGYAPFEQYSEGTGKQGPWTDVYALGACIHVGITGKKPVDSLCRGGSFLETGADIYQPLSISFKDKYSENFLLAIDNALMFKADKRPQNIFDWADMLLGKTQAPELPEQMFKPPVDDKTVLQTLPATEKSQLRSTAAPSRGTQGLVDARGKRNIENSSVLNSGRDNSIEPKQRTSTSNIPITTGRLQKTLPKFKKPLLLISISGFALILLLVASGIYFNDSAPLESSKPMQQTNKHLDQLLSQAEKAWSQKKYVTPNKASAYYFYQQALKLEPDNKTANKGIKEIESQLFILAKREYDNRNLTIAQQYLKQIEIVNPNSEQADKLNLIIQNHLNGTAQLNELLIKAEEKLKINEYKKPENDNAFYYYQQVLILDPNNQTADKGIKNIEQQLYKQADIAYNNKQYKKSLDYLAQLRSINPESKNAKSLQSKLDKKQSQHSQITSLLNKASRQKNNNRYTSPKTDNAFDSYNEILKLEPKNKQALDGLKNLQWHYKAQFKQHISASQLSKADADISIMKKIGAPSPTINQMQAELKTSKQKQSTAQTTPGKKTSAKQLNIHQASKIVGQFKASIEKKNKRKLNSVSQYMPGRKQFVDQLFSQYPQVTVKVSNFQLIPKENKVKADIELSNLIDINNNKVTPGSWNKFKIIIRYNNKDQLKVHW